MRAQRTRIAYILTPITFGGAEKVSLNFLRTVNRERFDVRPVVLIRPWEIELHFTSELRKLDYQFTTIPVALRNQGDPMRVLRALWQLYAYMKRESFDLVHTHGYFADICGQSAAKLLGIQGISTCHGFVSTDRKLRMYVLLDKFFLRLCKQVIAVSEGVRAELISSGIRASRITVIANGIPHCCAEKNATNLRKEKRKEMGVAADEFVVGYLGRLSTEKGVLDLIDAAERLHHSNILLKFAFIGEGPEKSALKRHARARGFAESVIFVDFQTDPENWYPALDIFVLPSHTEGTPLALLEALAAGLPVIATAVGGVPQIVRDGFNGLLMPPSQPATMSEKIQFLFDNPEACLRMGRAGIDTVKQSYGIEDWCKAVEDCYSRSL